MPERICLLVAALLGVLMFSGGLYLPVLAGVAPHWAIVPIGGVLLIAGWLLLAVAVAWSSDGVPLADKQPVAPDAAHPKKKTRRKTSFVFRLEKHHNARGPLTRPASARPGGPAAYGPRAIGA